MGVMSYVDLRTEIERPSPIMCSVAARRFAWPVQIARAIVGMRVYSIPAKQARSEPCGGVGGSGIGHQTATRSCSRMTAMYTDDKAVRITKIQVGKNVSNS